MFGHHHATKRLRLWEPAYDIFVLEMLKGYMVRELLGTPVIDPRCTALNTFQDFLE